MMPRFEKVHTLFVVFFVLNSCFGIDEAFKLNKNSRVMRAWTCHGRNQKDLVDRLCQASIIHTPAVKKLMTVVDRGNYVPKNSYMDAPQTIGLGQTISAPHIHARVLEEMHPYLVGKNNVTMLDVGNGSGYLTAALGRWIQPKLIDGGDTLMASILGTSVTGKVFGIDVHSSLIDLTLQNMRKQDGDLLDSGTVKVSLGDGWKGMKEEGPFDVIHVGAAADGMPFQLVSQLKVGGVAIIPIGKQSEVQHLYKIERIKESDSDYETFHSEDFRMTALLGVRYVPLVHPTESKYD
jgi:protein-L-isoaspartate(D-aspartate) O-methyltransferase